MKSGLTVVSDKLKAFGKTLEAMTDSVVLVGIPSKTAKREEPDGTRAPINNAAIGYINENGSPENNIPARPWLVPGTKDAEKAIASIFRTGSIAMLSGDKEGFDKAQDAAGLTAVNAVRAKLVNGPFQKLAEATLAARRRKGRTGTLPLNDEGLMRAAVTYVKRKRK